MAALGHDGPAAPAALALAAACLALRGRRGGGGGGGLPLAAAAAGLHAALLLSWRGGIEGGGRRGGAGAGAGAGAGGGGGGGGGATAAAAFTAGEWGAVASLLSAVLADYVARYGPLVVRCLPPPQDGLAWVAVAHGGAAGTVLGLGLAAAAAAGGRRRRSPAPSWFPAARAAAAAAGAAACVGRSLALSGGTAGAAVAVPPGRSLAWLAAFLAAPEPAGGGGRGRWIWLAYWAAVLAPASLGAVRLAASLRRKRKREGGGRRGRGRKDVVLARKYFHLVALALFVPPTVAVPSLMALAYAVAACLLLVMEAVRGDLPTGILRRGNGGGRMDLNGFYEAFLDEKDLAGGGEGGGGGRGDGRRFVVTHITLVCGCAIPLWISALLGHGDAQASVRSGLLPLLGVLVLGVGDTAAAAAGIGLGRTTWPGTRRTAEGSLAMLLSMVLAVVAYAYYLHPLPGGGGGGRAAADAVGEALGVLPELALLTALEACTGQIDNLVLPLAGSAIWLLREGA